VTNEECVALARKARAGDPSAEAALVKAHLPLARKLASAQKRTKWIDPHDLECEANRALLQAVRSFDPDGRRPFLPWAFTVIKNHLISHVRGRAKVDAATDVLDNGKPAPRYSRASPGPSGIRSDSPRPVQEPEEPKDWVPTPIAEVLVEDSLRGRVARAVHDEWTVDEITDGRSDFVQCTVEPGPRRVSPCLQQHSCDGTIPPWFPPRGPWVKRAWRFEVVPGLGISRGTYQRIVTKLRQIGLQRRAAGEGS